jgi:hypothetical protein
MTNHHNDITTDDQFIMHDAIEDLILDGASNDNNPVWITNEDGTGQWSDGWDGDEEIILPSPNDHQYWEHTHDDDEDIETLSLFVINLYTTDWSSEYGCHFIVAAKDERCARMIVDHEVVDRFRKGYEMECRKVGTADRKDPGMVSGFTT